MKLLQLLKPKLLFALFILCVFGFSYGTYKCRSSHDIKALNESNLNVSRDSIHHIVLKDGTRSVEKSSYTFTAKEFEQIILVKHDSIKRLKERVGNLNRLTNQLRLQLSLKGKVNVPIHDTNVIQEKDTFHFKAFYYDDNLLALHGVFQNDSAKLQYRVCANLDIATYWKKQGVFQSDMLTVNITSTNPNLEINGMSNYSIREEKRFYETRGFAFVTGIVAGYLIPK